MLNTRRAHRRTSPGRRESVGGLRAPVASRLRQLSIPLLFAVASGGGGGAAPATRPATRPASAAVADDGGRRAAPPFVIRCRRAGDAVTVAVERGTAVLTVSSPSGIGGATVQRPDGVRWPDELPLRLRLRGLESLRITGGDATLRVSVLSHSGHPRLLHLRRGGQPEGPELARGDPGWTDVRAFDADGEPADGLPVEGGWFELTVPKVLLSEQSESLTLDWVDFHRR